MVRPPTFVTKELAISPPTEKVFIYANTDTAIEDTLTTGTIHSVANTVMDVGGCRAVI